MNEMAIYCKHIDTVAYFIGITYYTRYIRRYININY